MHPLHLYAEHAVAGNEQPLITKPVEVRDLFWGGYQKPALMMQMLRYEVLGKDRFDAAFREYIRTWAFKHPTPADFFRLMRDQSGMELDWFWRDWIFTTARLDQAVDSVSRGSDGVTSIVLSNRGTMVMPAELSITFDDGDDVDGQASSRDVEPRRPFHLSRAGEQGRARRRDRSAPRAPGHQPRE